MDVPNNTRNHAVKIGDSLYIKQYLIDKVGNFTTNFEYETTKSLSEAQRMPKSKAEELCSALHAFHKIIATKFET